MDEILEKLPEEFNMVELHGKAEEKTPYVLVALQECERMNTLTSEIRRSLKELDLGLKVRMDNLFSAVGYNVKIYHLSLNFRVNSLSQLTWRIFKMLSSLIPLQTVGPNVLIHL